MSAQDKTVKLEKAANKRGVARLAAVQALYQMDLTSAKLMDVVSEFEHFRFDQEVDEDQGSEKYRAADAAWFRAILSGVIEQQADIDPLIHHNLPADWPLKRLETLLRSILRAGTWELRARKDVPVKVIISEYVDVAKAFYEDDEPKLVNGLLDRLARTLRDDEGMIEKADSPKQSSSASEADVSQTDASQPTASASESEDGDASK